MIRAYHIEKDFIASNNSLPHPIQDYLYFLVQGQLDDIRLFTNLDYCVAILMRLLNLDKGAGQKLLDTHKLYLILENVELFYITGKFFSISLGKHKDAPTYKFADCSQYRELPLIKGGYSAATAKEACAQSEATGQEIIQCLSNLGLHPTVLTSPIKAYQKEVLDQLDLPTVSDMPQEAAEWFYECSHRQWVEAFQIGHWDIAYDYDISSAYAAELADMPDIRCGTWIKDSVKPYNAILGVLRGWVDITSSFSPIMYEKERINQLEYYTPTGRWYTYITQAEADIIYDYNLGSFKLDEGWWFVPFEWCEYPMRKIMNNLHELKEKSSGLQKSIIKSIMVGCYGKTLESWSDRFGELFNPCWGTMVETNTRIKVFKLCDLAIRRGCQPLHISVDGVLLDKSLELASSNGLGAWKYSGAAPLIIASSGAVGFGNKQVEDNFALDYYKMRSLISDSPDSSCYKMKRPSLVSIPVAVEYNRWDKLGEVYDIERSIDIQGENKRYYPEAPTTGRELLAGAYSSEPWEVYLLEEAER